MANEKKKKFQNAENSNYESIQDLISTENGLVHYNHALVRKIIRDSEDLIESRKVLDFGAGAGSLAIVWYEILGFYPDCLEIAPSLLKILSERGIPSADNLGVLKPSYDVIYTSNVLEHIEDDLEQLREIYLNLSDQGKLIVYVPANQFLYSQMDEDLGHFRRYSKKEIENKLNRSGFKIIKIEFSDSVGFFALLLLKVLNINPKKTLGSGFIYRVYDTFFFRFSKLLDAVVMKKIIGKNLYVVAAKGN